MSESIGARLRQARELRRLTLPQVSETTKLRTHYLQALENDDYSAIPSAAQARGFLRLYADFLQLDLAELIPAAAPAAPAASTAAAVDQPPARLSLWSSLRERFVARVSKPQPDAHGAAAELPLAGPESTGPASVADAQVAAVTDTQTTKRVKPASSQVKKNAVK